MSDAILTLNAGSSSIKFALFALDEPNGLRLASRGAIAGIGTAPSFTAHAPSGEIVAERRWQEPAPEFGSLLSAVIAFAESHLGGDKLIGVGHRVVHGGTRYHRPERITPAVLAALRDLTPLAPLHQPHNLAPIEALATLHPSLPQIACFDTAFHRTMPEVATRFALPREYEAAGVRRYGFHGLSYEYVAGRLREIAPALVRGRVIAAHLGNGASLCALRDGRSIDTTMGFTALDGLVMGTRCGTLDAGVVLYLAQERGLAPDQIQHLLYERSGLLGVSGGIASDMQALLASDDRRAQEAIELFVYRIVREIGSLTSSLGGLDGIVFTAGIGEHAPAVRAMVCDGLRWLGVELEPAANGDTAGVISAPDSRIEVRVIPTDEEAMIARHALSTLRPPVAV
jgi:acetate kinase